MVGPKYAKKRDLNEPQIVAALSGIPGAQVERLDWPCDLVVGYKVRNIFLEVKPVGRVSRADQKEQKEWRENWPGQIRVVTTPEEAVWVVTNSHGGRGV